ncbi:hypothetical protein APHAL10511_002995 [Amanita phalloides]|nr:hypothetical protein APHAL10511_002995 [Amanita phalloides]
MFFIPYSILELPANVVLKTFRPSRWLPAITIVWGIVVVLTGLVRTYPQLVGARVALGAAEAGLFPGIAHYLTFWYPRHKLQTRIALFFGSASLAGAFSGILAYGIGFLSGVRHRLGWSWIFILEGLATVVVGFLALLGMNDHPCAVCKINTSQVMVDFPETAKFLTPEERAWVLHQKKLENSLVGEEEHLEARHIKAAISDWQIWLHILIYMSVVTPLYGFTFFLPTIIHGFGYSTAVSQLLTVPPYALATMATYAVGYFSDKYRLRSPFIFSGLVFIFIGLAINISNVANGIKYFGTFWIVVGAYAVFPGIVAWPSNNLSGQYKRGIGSAIQIGIGNFSGAFAANVYRTKDEPRYILGHGIMMMFAGIGVICVPIAVISYTRINHKRDKLLRELSERGDKISAEEIKKLGDRAPTFRYII